ncbi:hypothetical protein [Bradyrhizobium sp. CCBAU 51627]|uniref:hypothetical protein n=1 Tax=Bradyrhizobium sp. CCBAU 51627 TaxID=1325088 RepID=UPI0023062FF2|nr:hypothetical protein [Bradyrhizobium sp. CCBAU 51627]MDA9437466.1 hypothetical protein [Bradyrhizobium sp. CCBAU 51627]
MLPLATLRHRIPIDGEVRPVPAMATDNLLGALGIMMSARDAARWLAYHLGGQAHGSAIAETHLLQIAKRDRRLDDGYGLGWVRPQPARPA